MVIMDRRILGPTTQFPVADTHEHPGSITITNNVDGYLLKATGEADRIAGIPKLVWDSTNVALTASGDVYVSGSNNYLYLHGLNAAGEDVSFKVSIEGNILKIVE